MAMSSAAAAAPSSMVRLELLLAEVARLNGSDLHLKAGVGPSVRIDGELKLLVDEEAFTASETEAMARAMMAPQVAALFERSGEADFTYTVPGAARFRVNAFRQRGQVSVAFRLLPTTPRSAEELGLPATVYRLASERRGMVLVTGPSGSGKTTTMGTMIDYMNRTRPCHIITIEDPVEFLHRDDLARIEQREVGLDTESFATAVRAVMRQDPDVIMVGEIRDVDTADAALKAAESGHFVVSTLNTLDASETINRIVDFYAPSQQRLVRISLARTLRGTIAQRLLHRADGTGRLPAIEVMMVNGRVRDFILGKEQADSIDEIIRDGGYDGMVTFDQSLGNLFADGSVTLAEALQHASNQHDLLLELERSGLVSN